ncbi:hypothetical protein SynA1840_02130 [Synechococcus sp. A18-40]|nr:hypothetical protein SynA1840_02130 [Synechococcus sp. A18-40]
MISSATSDIIQSWGSVAFSDYRQLPEKPGIYACLNAAGETLYIGQALNLFDRWNSGHHRAIDIACAGGSSIHWMWIEPSLLDEVEHSLLLKHRPSLNKVITCPEDQRLERKREMARLAARRRRRANGEVTTPAFKKCEVCGNEFEPKRSTARFCSTKCRVATHRSARAGRFI